MTIQLTQTGSVNFIQSGNTESTNSVADIRITNIGNINTDIGTNVGSSKNNGLLYFTSGSISSNDFIWGPQINEANPTLKESILNNTGRNLNARIRIIGIARNFNLNSSMTGQFFIANSSGTLINTFYEFTLPPASDGGPFFEPSEESIDSGFITVSIPANGSIRVIDNFPEDSNAHLRVNNSTISIEILDNGGIPSNTYMTITTSGNVGIGTTSPNYTLDINGTLEAANSNGVFLFNSTGNIGVGTTSPSSKFTIGSNNTNTSRAVSFRNQFNNGQLGIAAESGQYSNFAVAGDVVLRSNSGKLFLTSSSGNLGICVNTSGNVGIDTSSPAQTLSVSGGISASGFEFPITRQGGYLQWNRSVGVGETWLLNQKGIGGANAGIRFGNATANNVVTEAMRIIDNGNVGIGTTSPSANLHVVGTMNAPGGTFGNVWVPEVGGAFINFTDVSSGYNIINGVFHGFWQGKISSAGGMGGTFYHNLPANPKDGSNFIGYWMTSRYVESIFRIYDAGTSQAALSRPGSMNNMVSLESDIAAGEFWTLTYQFLI